MPVPGLAPPQGFVGQSTPTAADVVVGLSGRVDAATIAGGLALLPAAGGTVYVKAGTYSISSTITVPSKPVKIVGSGKEAVTVDIGANVIAAFTVPGDEPFELSGVTIEGSGAAGQVGVKDAGAGSRSYRTAITLKDLQVGAGAVTIESFVESAGAGIFAILERCDHSGGTTGRRFVTGAAGGVVHAIDCESNGSIDAGGVLPVTAFFDRVDLDTGLGTPIFELGNNSFVRGSRFLGAGTVGELRLRNDTEMSDCFLNVVKIVLKGNGITISGCRIGAGGAGTGLIETDGTQRSRITVVGCVAPNAVADGVRWDVVDSTVTSCVNFRIVETGTATRNQYAATVGLASSGAVVNAGSSVDGWEKLGVGPTSIASQTEVTVLANQTVGANEVPEFNFVMKDTPTTEQHHQYRNTNENADADQSRGTWVRDTSGTVDFRIRHNDGVSRDFDWWATKKLVP